MLPETMIGVEESLAEAEITSVDPLVNESSPMSGVKECLVEDTREGGR